jgi:hypothetical protein
MFCDSIWEELRKGASADVIASEQDELLAGMEAAFKALKRLQKVSDAFQGTFPLEADIKAMDPAASAEAVAAAEKAVNIVLVCACASPPPLPGSTSTLCTH